MPIMRKKEIARMNKREKEEKLKELKLELIKANVVANKSNAKTREIKRAISRLLTYSESEMFNKSDKEMLKKK